MKYLSVLSIFCFVGIAFAAISFPKEQGLGSISDCLFCTGVGNQVRLLQKHNLSIEEIRDVIFQECTLPTDWIFFVSCEAYIGEIINGVFNSTNLEVHEACQNIKYCW
ncbi:uncharacterized protein LOC114329041 [Diabrotica virgifera virgifera]|uniref:Uncharacterized protein LOC114329041 n=1 Tax=Diabrotica virgifera virgifera TaxID=50390 RepID=A0A6P7FCY1_DIAVI|nr:uncharacterized protein LOC114329041 [Diabrotica virgifera virgifera]